MRHIGTKYIWDQTYKRHWIVTKSQFVHTHSALYVFAQKAQNKSMAVCRLIGKQQLWPGLIGLVSIQKSKAKAPSICELKHSKSVSGRHNHTVSLKGCCGRERYSTYKHRILQNSGTSPSCLNGILSVLTHPRDSSCFSLYTLKLI